MKLQVLKFGASWCGPCKVLNPIFTAVEEEYAAKGELVEFTKFDIDSEPEASIKYGIRNVPTILYVINDEVKEKQVGVVNQDAIRQLIEKYK